MALGEYELTILSQKFLYTELILSNIFWMVCAYIWQVCEPGP